MENLTLNEQFKILKLLKIIKEATSQALTEEVLLHKDI